MRKIFSLSLVAVSAVFLSACSLTQPKEMAPVNEPVLKITDSDDGKGLMEMAKNLMSGQGYRCTFTLKENGQTMTYALKGKKMMMSFQSPEDPTGTTNMLADEKYSYMWSPTTKQGMKFAVPKDATGAAKLTPPDDTPVSAPEAVNFEDAQALAEAQLKYDIECVPVQLSDSDFVPPADVVFQDLSAMMESAQQNAGQGMMIPGYPGAAGAGAAGTQMMIPPQPGQ